MKLIQIGIVLACVMLVAALPVHAQSAAAGRSTGIFREGERAPALELPTVDGKSTLDLSSLAGRKAIFLQFASW